jgi:hypothetical protein
VVEKSVEDGGGDGGVAVEDGGPLLEGFVGGQHDGAVFVAGADDLEEQIRAVLVDGQLADFVEDKHGRAGVSAQLGFEGAFELGGAERVDDVDGGGEEDVDALLAGGVSERAGEMGFTEADEAQEDDVGFVMDELEAEEVLDFETVDLFWPVPAEGVEGFDDGEAPTPEQVSAICFGKRASSLAIASLPFWPAVETTKKPGGLAGLFGV